ncbi:uncharacterized protein LOC123561569 [Mercenaria mercenaria]|uniref:uncharacterized protein LOC123561569 n=1 Tax=Mercenaria mercenaria TaxID=6596 RepID=UPI00234F2695|nr:uncharacterized protein LOC123561569 [Mercenaria mercenaria]
MADKLVVQQGQTGFGSSCFPCGVGSSQLAVHEGNACSKCTSKGCVGCYSRDMKPDLSSEARLSNSATDEHEVTLKKGLSSDDKKKNERADTGNISSKGSLQTLIPPVKHPQVAQVKPRNVQNVTHTSLLNNDGAVPNNGGNILHDRSDLKLQAKYIKPISKQNKEPRLRNTYRFRGKRNERGLCSKSDVSDEIDNRYIYLVTTEKNKGKALTKDMTMGNVFTGSLFRRSMMPQRPNQGLRSSKMNKEHHAFQKAKHRNERNDTIKQSFKNADQSDSAVAARRKHLQNSAIHSEQGVLHSESETHLQNVHFFGNTSQARQENVTEKPEIYLKNNANHPAQKNTHLIPETFSQNSQFYNNTITYPNATGVYPPTRVGQITTTGHNYQQYHGSYNAEDLGEPWLALSHTERQSVRLSSQMERDEFYHDPFGVESIEDLNDFDDIPAYDEIPYALIMAGSVDGKTLLRAKQKQRQQVALDLIKVKLEDGEEIGNAAADFGNESIYQGNPDILKVANKFDRNEDLRPAVEERISNVADHTKCDDAMNISAECGKKDEDIESQRSPFHISDKKNRTASFANTKEVDFVNDEEEKSVNEYHGNQRADRDDNRFIREKQLTTEENCNTINARGTTKKHSDRGVTLHSDAIHKSGFRSNVPNMKGDNTQHQTGESLEASAHDTHPVDLQAPSETNDKEVEPIALKLLRRQKQQGQIKHVGFFRKSLEHADNTDENLVEPIAMRLLRQSREAKKRAEERKSLQGALSKLGSGNAYDKPISFLNAVRDIFGVTSGNLPIETKQGTAKIYDGGADATHPKLVKKNKNKNVSPVSKQEQECFDGLTHRTEDIKDPSINDYGVNKQLDSEEDTEDNDSKVVPVSGSSGIQNHEALLKIADNRHKAFKKLKTSQSEDNLKCTSCGSPECQGHNIRKMKEMIKMAKQAGFEVRDVIPDGNCMFAAVVDQLQLYGDYRFGPKSLREAAVSWLIDHPDSDDGTPFSSFLSEDWGVYLQRMIVEGEWGDHLSLRAIVEVVGYTIKVINVSGEEARDTVLEPASATSKDGMHLVLGHLGEFHYTSLRPADDRNTSFVPAPVSPTAEDLFLTFDGEQLALEGTETVEMFREDYIDTWSDLPSAHFSFLLKNVIPVKVVNTAAIVQSQRMDSVRNPDLFPVRVSQMVLIFASSEINLPQSDESLSSLYWNQYCALRCLVWPECAKSWISRVRREGWPSKDCISSIESEGCLLLPNAHKESRSPSLEWQFSFTLCERKLFRDALSLYQKYCYIVFYALCTHTMHHLKSISSSHFKSVFFYACERIPAEYWESCPGACVFYMLNELLRYVRAKDLPNYFVHDNNMIDHLMEKDLKEIEEHVILLRSQLVLFLRQINETLFMLPHGNTVIDKISDDIAKFKEHKSLKRSTLEVFIPATIDTAHYYIRMRSLEQGYEILSQAFQQRLSVSTCDDSVPFQIFLTGAVSGLDLDSLVWFSAYTDRQLEGQISKSLVRETCGDLHLVRINDILPADVVGSYGNTEVPAEFLARICAFCHDFAKFLFQTNKLSEILPILYHCHELFVKKLEDTKSHRSTNSKNDEQPSNEDFTDEAMFDIYIAMYTVYKKQQQLEFFRPVMRVVDAIVERIHTRGVYNCLCHMYLSLGDTDKRVISSNIYAQLPKDPQELKRVTAFLHWPYKSKAIYLT